MSDSDAKENGDSEMERQVVADSEYNTKIIEMFSIIQGSYDSLISNSPLSNEPSFKMTRSNLMLKLPEVKINSFSDNNTNLFTFYQFKISFQSAMARVEGVTLANKLVYLKPYSKGRVLPLIDNYPINDDSYDTAWQVLEEEFLIRGF